MLAKDPLDLTDQEIQEMVVRMERKEWEHMTDDDPPREPVFSAGMIRLFYLTVASLVLAAILIGILG